MLVCTLAYMLLAALILHSITPGGGGGNMTVPLDSCVPDEYGGGGYLRMYDKY